MVVGAGLIASAAWPEYTADRCRWPTSSIDGLWIALSVFLVLVALGLTYVLVRLGGTVGQLTSFLKGLERETLPVINESAGTLQRVNAQLDKADLVTDSAVDIADSVDTAVRAVTFAITRPGADDRRPRRGHRPRGRVTASPQEPAPCVRGRPGGRAAKEQEIADELSRGGTGAER